MKQRNCWNCSKDISYRHKNAVLCINCRHTLQADARREKRRQERERKEGVA